MDSGKMDMYTDGIEIIINNPGKIGDVVATQRVVICHEVAKQTFVNPGVKDCQLLNW